jgi:hypothetical protein
MTLLADGGYSGAAVITPMDCDKRPGLRRKHAAYRSVGEQVIGLAQSFRLCSGVFRGSPELHEVALMLVYYVVAMKTLSSSMRPELVNLPSAIGEI